MHTIQLKEHNVDAGYMRIQAKGIIRSIKSQPTVIDITGYGDAERQRVSRFIADQYRSHYNACINVDYPNYISVRNGQGTILAAAGFRYAGDNKLFLEQYMERPVESVLGVSRQQIVEIGNLASLGGGASLFLFMALASYLKTGKTSHAMVTSTASLERRFKLLGLKPERICAADPARLAPTAEQWGSYYDAQPWVLSGSVDASCDRLRGLFGEEYFEYRPQMFPRLHFQGLLK